MLLLCSSQILAKIVVRSSPVSGLISCCCVLCLCVCLILGDCGNL